jgi:ABC-type uncharacterized transport system ATPase component
MMLKDNDLLPTNGIGKSLTSLALRDINVQKLTTLMVTHPARRITPKR